jgi:hypothetical protein
MREPWRYSSSVERFYRWRRGGDYYEELDSVAMKDVSCKL